MKTKKYLTALMLSTTLLSVVAQNKTCSSSLENNVVDLNTIGKCAIEKFKNSNKQEFLQISSRKKRYVRRNQNNYLYNLRKNVKSHSDLKKIIYTTDNVDKLPLFSGCASTISGSRESQLTCFESEIQTYVNTNLNYPKEVLSEGIEDKVLTTFTINTNGFVKDVEVESTKKISALENEAKRVINSLPQLKPAKHNNVVTEVKYKVYVNFKLTNKNISKAKEKIMDIQNNGYIKDYVSLDEINEKPVFITCLGEAIDSQECIKETITKSILENLNYPFDAAAEGIEGRVWVRFLIDKGGYLTNITTSGPENGILLEKEAERLVKLLPKFLPGKQKGEYVNVEYFMPFDFYLDE